MSSLNNIETLASIYADQVQELDDAAQGVKLEVLNLDVAVGAQLDIIGRILGLDREGLDDSTYRPRLRAKISVNKSSGTADDIIAALTDFLPSGTSFVYREYDQARAGFEVEIFDTLDFGLGELAGLVARSAKAAGVNGYVIYHQSTPIFAFDAAGGAKFDYDDADTNAGFSVDAVAIGSVATLGSTTTDLTTELALNDIIAFSGFSTGANNGQYRVTGAVTTGAAEITPIDGRTPVVEAAGASVTLETEGYGLRGARG